MQFVPLTVSAKESWVKINRRVTAVKAPPMAGYWEGEISEALVSELYLS